MKSYEFFLSFPSVSVDIAVLNATIMNTVVFAKFFLLSFLYRRSLYLFFFFFFDSTNNNSLEDK